MTTSTGTPPNDRLQQLQRMLEKSPDDPFLLYGIGMEHKKAGDEARAIEFFNRTITADPGYCYAYYQRGLVCESRGDEAGARLAYEEGIVAARRKGLTYTGKYAVLVQQLPVDHRIDVLRLVMGQTLVPEYEELGRLLFEAFRLPLMKVRIVVTTKEYLLSAIEPLPFGELTEEDRAHLEGMGTWRG